jgi:hypothetical protein
LIARRVALPDGTLHVVPMTKVLPPELSQVYASELAGSALLRSAPERASLDVAAPLHRPRVAGSRSEYVRLVGRLLHCGMISWTSQPRAVNGVFTVGKDADSDRLIIDAQPANRCFVDCPPVELPDPSHLVQLQVPSGAQLFVGKSDLSNFYHHIGLPAWMQPYFALPSLTPEELASLGAPAGTSGPLHPMCVTLPMGFSHAVFLAQQVHEHLVYNGPTPVLRREHSVLSMLSPQVTARSALHGIVIDDFFLFSLRRGLAERQLRRVLAAYRKAGFVVKESKVVMPTSEPVKVIGFECAASSLHLPLDSCLSLLAATFAVLRDGHVTGRGLAHLVGRWTWALLVRRPALSVLQHVYRFANVARGRRFRLWPCVRRELTALVGLLPLLRCQLDAPLHSTLLATDASEFGAGVVSTPLTPTLLQRAWPMLSSRRRVHLQTLLHADSAANPLLSPELQLSDSHRAALQQTQCWYASFYSDVLTARWSTLVSFAWRDPGEHINALELRTVLLAVRWLLSRPSSLNSRVCLLVDSTVTLYSLWKGRSSSPALRMVLRPLAALLLAGGLTLCPGWVPSEINPADGPSRRSAPPAPP